MFFTVFEILSRNGFYVLKMVLRIKVDIDKIFETTLGKTYFTKHVGKIYFDVLFFIPIHSVL
jgi:hypothetical protein